MAGRYSHTTGAKHLVSNTGGRLSYNGYWHNIFLVSLTGMAHFRDLRASIGQFSFKVNLLSALAELPVQVIPHHKPTFYVQENNVHLGLAHIENKREANDSGYGVYRSYVNVSRDEIVGDLPNNFVKDELRIKTAFYATDDGRNAYIHTIGYKVELLLHWTGQYERDF